MREAGGNRGVAAGLFFSDRDRGFAQVLDLMFDLFAFAEANLRRAGWLLGLEILGSAGAAMVLSELGYPAELAIVAVWLLNVVTAWFIGKAAAAQGKSQWLHGLPALAPPIAIWLLFKLHSEDALRRLSAGSLP